MLKVTTVAYFDNAATTFPKPECVYSFADEFYRTVGGNAGRGIYAQAVASNRLIDETRNLLAELFHCGTKQVIFLPSATFALNVIIQGIILRGAKNVYVSPFEHNAVTRTLHRFAERGLITVTELTVTDALEFDMHGIRRQFENLRPNFLIVSHASNVIGLIAPVEKICALAKTFGATTLVDMAQTAGLVDLNVGLETIDFAVFAGHKTLFAPTGTGGFVMNPAVELEPILFGGTGFDSANQNLPDTLPERFEVGTLNISGLAGLNAALKWIAGQTTAKLFRDEQIARRRLLKLLSEYEFLKIVGNVDGRDYVGIVSCVMTGVDSVTAGELFSARGIAVRAGLHCAPFAHKFLGTLPAGTIRFSVNCMTTDEDFAELQRALDDIGDEI